MKAGLQYFVLSAVSLGFFLFGCVLLSVIMRETNIQVTNSVMSEDVSQILISISLLFKLSAAPQSHVSPRWIKWTPENYYGFVGYCSQKFECFLL